MTNIQFIQNQLNTPVKGIENTVQLLSEDCTIPFISRYRKDQTGNLDEVQIEQIFKLNKQLLDMSILESKIPAGPLAEKWGQHKANIKVVNLFISSMFYLFNSIAAKIKSATPF